MKPIAILMSLGVLLAGCGADGPPSPPPAREKPPAERPAVGLDISGTAEVGVTGSL